MSGTSGAERKLPVTVCSEGGPLEQARAAALAERLSLPLRSSNEVARPAAVSVPGGRGSGRRRERRATASSGATGPGWCLAATPQGLILVGPGGARTAPKFLDGRAATHARENDLASQPYARALGIAALTARLQRPVHVLDATAGFGSDAWVAAALGAHITLCERDPVVHALLEDALDRAGRLGDQRTRVIAARITLLQADITHPEGRLDADLVYLDPMYPERRKRGGSRKQIDALQGVVGHDSNNENLLDDAVEVARVRVVVKRPRGAVALHSVAGHRPNDAINGPNTRYDRYLRIDRGRAD